MRDLVEGSSRRRRLLLGPPGCGKTHNLIQLVQIALENGIPPDRIGFVSYTRKAVEEARSRAGTAFNLTDKDMPYFRTLHSFAFRALGLTASQVMNGSDWSEFGKSLGIDMAGVDYRAAEDGLILPQSLGGDRYINMIERSKMRCIPLEQEFSEVAQWDMSLPFLRKISAELEVFKSAYGKVTFVDMIDTFVKIGEAPRLEVLIIDEAQDLTPLQWQMAEILIENARVVVIAGDDDQCIHRWAGVNVKLFMNCAQDRQVLTQSYRLTQPVFDVAAGVVKRIRTRLPKDYHPNDKPGSVSRAMGRRYLDLREGSWTCISRTNKYAREWASQLWYDGYFYSLYGKSSVDPKLAAAIHAWRNLQSGKALFPGQVKQLYETLPKSGDAAAVRRGATKLLEAMDPTARYDYDALCKEFGLLAARDNEALDVLRVGKDVAEYIRSLERRGEDISSTPRIKLSTIHAMKGGEDENVAVDLSSTKACVNSQFPDDEHRTFYVGVTRAKTNLHLVHSDKEYRYVV